MLKTYLVLSDADRRFPHRSELTMHLRRKGSLQRSNLRSLGFRLALKFYNGGERTGSMRPLVMVHAYEETISLEPRACSHH